MRISKPVKIALLTLPIILGGYFIVKALKKPKALQQKKDNLTVDPNTGIVGSHTGTTGNNSTTSGSSSPIDVSKPLENTYVSEVTTHSSSRMREHASTDAAIIKTFSSGVLLSVNRITAQDKDGYRWYQVFDGSTGRTGYMREDIVDIAYTQPIGGNDTGGNSTQDFPFQTWGW